jgi:hypothetical protein
MVTAPVERSEVRGHRQRIGKSAALTEGQCLRRALSPTFRSGELVFFIPWRLVAENPAWRILLLDPPGPALRLLADVADSTLVIFRFGATMELGRSERPTMRPLGSYGVDGADSPDRKPGRLGFERHTTDIR